MILNQKQREDAPKRDVSSKQSRADSTESQETPERVSREELYNQWVTLGQKAENEENLAKASRCYSWALTYKEDKDLEKKLLFLEQKLRSISHTDKNEFTLLEQASEREKNGDYIQALQKYEELARSSRNSKSLQTKIAFCRQIISMEEALENLRKRVEILIEKGYWDSAIAEYEKFLALFETWPPIKTKVFKIWNGFCKAKDSRDMLKKVWMSVSILIAQKQFAKAISKVNEIEMDIPKQGLIVRIQSLIEKEMAFIPAGSFWMGNNNYSDERPFTKRTLPGFYMDIYEVTQESYNLFAQSTGHPCKLSDVSPTNEDWKRLPITNVSWRDASKYAEWIDKRLPTEAEWEKAARGTEGYIFPWGNSFFTEYCNCSESEHKTCKPVGSFPQGKSPYGCFDMAGNVLEWTDDAYRPYGETSPGIFQPGYRVARGGSWHYGKDALRCSNRYPFVETVRLISLGFRCAMNGNGD